MMALLASFIVGCGEEPSDLRATQQGLTYEETPCEDKNHDECGILYGELADALDDPSSWIEIDYGYGNQAIITIDAEGLNKGLTPINAYNGVYQNAKEVQQYLMELLDVKDVSRFEGATLIQVGVSTQVNHSMEIDPNKHGQQDLLLNLLTNDKGEIRLIEEGILIETAPEAVKDNDGEFRGVCPEYLQQGPKQLRRIRKWAELFDV